MLNNLLNFSNTSDNNSINNLNDYPLNIIFDINLMVYAALFFLILIFNVFLGKYLLNKNYTKYLFNNSFHHILYKLLVIYIKLWRGFGKTYLITCHCMLFISVISCRLSIVTIFNYDGDKTIDINNILKDYPLNLLFEINTLLYAALLFLFIILNIYIGKYISNLNYKKILPENKLGKILYFLINHYLRIWGKTSHFILVFSYIMLFIAVFVSKITLYIIIKFYS